MPQPMFSKRNEEYWREYFVYEFRGSLQAGSPNKQTIQQSISVDADFEIQRLSGIKGFFALKFIDASSDTYYSNSFIYSEAFIPQGLNLSAGSFIDFVIPYPLKVSAGTSFLIELLNFAQTDYCFALHGAKLRKGIAPYKRKNYKYRKGYTYGFENNYVFVPAGQSREVSIVIDKNSDFLVLKISGGFHKTNPFQSVYDNDTYPDGVTVKISDSTGAYWSESPVQIGNFAGKGMFPNDLTKTGAYRFLPFGSVLNVFIENKFTSDVYVSLYFHGVKLY